MASWEKENRIDISEQRKNLNKLEEEIERELAGKRDSGVLGLIL